MSKLKLINQNGQSRIIVKSRSGQELNEREAQMINDGRAEGFLLFDVERKGSTFQLVYPLYDLVPLPAFLQTAMLSKRMFGILLRVLLTAVNRVEEYHFSKDLLQLHLQQVMIAPDSWRIYLLYIPIQPYAAEGTLKEMLLDIVRYASFDPNEDLTYVQEYIRIINDGVVFSAFSLEEYVDRLLGVVPLAPSPAHEVHSAAASWSEAGGAEQRATPAGRYNPVPPSPPSADRAEAAFTVNEDASGNVTVFRAAKNAPSAAWLERKGDPHRWVIDRTPYRMGKMAEGNDHQIPNNAVSRKHAEIVREQGVYYVLDLNSTNGTYLDGRRINWGVKEELKNGSRLQLANEEFIFYME